jgi:hypothetical protein
VGKDLPMRGQGFRCFFLTFARTFHTVANRTQISIICREIDKDAFLSDPIHPVIMVVITKTWLSP